MKEKLSHTDKLGRARMVDISGKGPTSREAIAEGRVLVSKELLRCLKDNALEKGDALSAARLAGIMAAKKTAEIIPLCHPLPLSFVGIDLKPVDDPPAIKIRSTVRTDYKTGVEMEALVAVSVAALTIYDMGKSVDKGAIIDGIRLIKKRGGKSGSWKANPKRN